VYLENPGISITVDQERGRADYWEGRQISQEVAIKDQMSLSVHTKEWLEDSDRDKVLQLFDREKFFRKEFRPKDEFLTDKVVFFYDKNNNVVYGQVTAVQILHGSMWDLLENAKLSIPAGIICRRTEEEKERIVGSRVYHYPVVTGFVTYIPRVRVTYSPKEIHTITYTFNGVSEIRYAGNANTLTIERRPMSDFRP
jgi:hypothetical protein